MKIYPRNSQTFRARAFTLVEVLIAVAVIGIAVTALYMSLSSGFRLVQSARENLRATQIMVERLETVRLYHWDQINTPGFVPVKFTNYYNHADNSGFPYYGEIAWGNFDGSESYASEMKMITITLTWTTDGVTRNRIMQSLIAEKGIQNYVY